MECWTQPPDLGVNHESEGSGNKQGGSPVSICSSPGQPGGVHIPSIGKKTLRIYFLKISNNSSNSSERTIEE
jgi:hypothetical protein